MPYCKIMNIFLFEMFTGFLVLVTGYAIATTPVFLQVYTLYFKIIIFPEPEEEKPEIAQH